jgi:uncharacterized protein (TIGR03435 family)
VRPILFYRSFENFGAGHASVNLMRLTTRVFFAIVFATLAFGQALETRPTFEAADVHVSTITSRPFMRGPWLRSGRYEVKNATMVDLISTAYNTNSNEVLGGPSWLEWDRFDVAGKVPAGTTQDTAKLMLQSLLAERFGVVIRKDNKPRPAYALTAAKKTLLRESDGTGEPGCRFVPPPGGPPPPPADGSPPPLLQFQFNCRNMPMDRFAIEFRDMNDLDDRPIVDRTALQGAWDFDIKFNPNMRANFSGERVTLHEAIEKLGLKLEPVNAPFPVLVVDKANQKPRPNVANLNEILKVPPPPTEFEVAEVKPTNPDFQGRRLQIQQGGRVNASGVTLKFVLQQAWNLNDDMLVGAPKWIDEDRYDIVAKGPNMGPGFQLDIEDLWVMMRSLLKERFKLETHMETRDVNAYTLSAGKPKMQKADPESRTTFKEGPGSDGKDPRAKNQILSRLVTVQNMTMDQFAAQLQYIASGYIKSPVLDSTGLEGSYTFTLSFSPVGAVNPGGGRGGDLRGGPPQPSAAAGEASDPSGAITLFEAIDKQIGLKLQQQKRPVQVLVIDHVERKPVEN